MFHQTTLRSGPAATTDPGFRLFAIGCILAAIGIVAVLATPAVGEIWRLWISAHVSLGLVGLNGFALGMIAIGVGLLYGRAASGR